MSAMWDQRISNDAAMAEKCMGLGAVILEPPSKRAAEFKRPDELRAALALPRPVTPSPGVKQS